MDSELSAGDCICLRARLARFVASGPIPPLVQDVLAFMERLCGRAPVPHKAMLIKTLKEAVMGAVDLTAFAARVERVAPFIKGAAVGQRIVACLAPCDLPELAVTAQSLPVLAPRALNVLVMCKEVLPSVRCTRPLADLVSHVAASGIFSALGLPASTPPNDQGYFYLGGVYMQLTDAALRLVWPSVDVHPDGRMFSEFDLLVVDGRTAAVCGAPLPVLLRQVRRSQLLGVVAVLCTVLDAVGYVAGLCTTPDTGGLLPLDMSATNPAFAAMFQSMYSTHTLCALPTDAPGLLAAAAAAWLVAWRKCACPFTESAATVLEIVRARNA